MRIPSTPVFSCFIVLSLQLAAFAQGTLFVSVDAFVDTGEAADRYRLYTIDPATADAVEIGPILHVDTMENVPQINGLAGDAAGRLLGIGLDSRIYSLDTATANAQDITPSFEPLFSEGGIAVDRSSNTAFAFGAGHLWKYDFDADHDFLEATELGTPLLNGEPFPGSNPNFDGWSYRGDDLYALVTIQAFELSGHLVRIDTDTLEVTVVGPTGLSTLETAGLEYNPLGDFFYAAGRHDRTLYAIDPNSAVATPLGNHDLGGITGLAFVVPEPAALSIFLFAIGLLGAGARQRPPRERLIDVLQRWCEI